MITGEVSSLPSLPVLDKINRRQVNENFEEDAGGDEIAIPVCALGIVKGTTRKTHYTVRNMRNTFANIPRLLTSPLWLLIATCGPRFMIEPTHRLEFMNRAGSRLDCTASGNPTPNVEWLDQDNNLVTTIPKVRHILANGSLYFPPFEAEAFRQDVHWTNYKCLATNAVGSIVSADVNIKAVVNQRYDPEVQNPSGFIGGNVVIRCNIPPFVKEHVSVTSWLQEPSFNIYPSLEGDGKYHMLPTGELLIINVTRNDANKKTFRCRTHHKLTQEAVVSSNAGRIQLSEIRESVPPIMNEKLIKLVANYEYIVVPCVAYANPKPIYRWQMKRNGREESLDELLNTGRATIRDGTLTIMSLKETDNGSYFCTATNSEGSETMEVQLVVNTPLNVHIAPPSQTIDLGKAAFFRCSVTGTPQSTITWLKDSQPLRTGARVRLLATDHIKITSTTKEDRGMYQCFATNDFNAVQATAELRLGEVAPHLTYKFIEQTMQPGPSVSLKCSATGNPTPQISWSLDGFPLPSNDRLMIGQYVTIFGDVISHVNISAVKSEDGGEYECAAKSISGSTSHSARLNVYGMPYIRPMSQISAVAGKTMNIKCPVAGYPIESIVWEKDNTRLPINM
uniref:Ig-like domain-containing protein n=1 Tax=Lutzomyia longipalpis TaxID=7200 RepID=A0A1B0CC48_LUTLO